MSISALLRAQFQEAQELLEAVIDDCDPATLAHVSAGATIGSIAAIYAHAVHDEDRMIASALDRTSVYDAGNWTSVLAIPGALQTRAWAQTAQIDIVSWRPYAAEVYATTDRALAATPDDAWSATIETFRGETQRAQFLGAIAVVHLAGHQGEISAIKPF